MPRMPPTTDDLRDAELALQKALLEGDADALEQLLDDESEWTGSDGATLTKGEQIEAHRTAAVRCGSITSSRAACACA